MTAYDPTNERHIAIQKRAEKAEQDRRDTYVGVSMGTVEGRSYFHYLLSARCHVFANPQAVHGADLAIQTAFACGELNVGQQVLADIMRVCPDDYVKMMREANARELANATSRTRSDADSGRDDSGPEPYVHPAFERGNGNSPTEREDSGEE